MTSNFVELGRRAVACGHWRWMPGAVDQHGRRVLAVEVDEAGGCRLHYASEAGRWWLPLDLWSRGVGGVEAVPDFDDAATKGCLVQLVREAWDDPMLHAEPEPDGSWMAWFRVTPRVGHRAGGGTTEAEALVAALEAAPAKAGEVAP